MAQTAYLRPECEVREPQIDVEAGSAEIIDFPAERARKTRPGGTIAPREAPLALIYRPARSATTSGPRAKTWRLDLQPTRPQWLEPLMGWTSDDDPSRQISLSFSTKEAALDFAKRQGWRAIALPENRRKPVIKTRPESLRRVRAK